jgi:hypothetical protein
MGIKALRVNEIEMVRLRSRSFMSKPKPLKKFRRFIENSNWDGGLLKYEKWIDVSCVAVIVVSVLFFVPVTLSVFRGY